MLLSYILVVLAFTGSLRRRRRVDVDDTRIHPPSSADATNARHPDSCHSQRHARHAPHLANRALVRDLLYLDTFSYVALPALRRLFPILPHRSLVRAMRVSRR